MQKISSYLYPNRIQTIVDLALTPLEWRIVYQRKFKIYQGLDNVLEIDVKNSEQKRQDITGLNMQFVLMDELNEGIYQTEIDVATGITGIGRVLIPATAVADLAPQFLKYTIYIQNDDDTLTPVYGDTQYGVTGTIDLLGGAMPSTLPPIFIKKFLLLTDDTNPSNLVATYISELAEIHRPNFITSTPTFSVDFYPVGLSANVTVQVTDNTSIGLSDKWRDIDTFSVTPSTNLITKTYVQDTDYKQRDVWFRVKYIPPQGLGATFDVTKVDGNYDLILNRPGYSYHVGNQIKILGSQVGGDDGANDIIITVTAVNTMPVGGIQTIGFTWTGSAFINPQTDNIAWRNVPGTTLNSTGTFDKIVVRL
jgi:hypothetical protein